MLHIPHIHQKVACKGPDSERSKPLLQITSTLTRHLRCVAEEWSSELAAPLTVLRICTYTQAHTHTHIRTHTHMQRMYRVTSSLTLESLTRNTVEIVNLLRFAARLCYRVVQSKTYRSLAATIDAVFSPKARCAIRNLLSSTSRMALASSRTTCRCCQSAIWCVSRATKTAASSNRVQQLATV